MSQLLHSTYMAAWCILACKWMEPLRTATDSTVAVRDSAYDKVPQQEDPYLPASPSAAIAKDGRLIASKSAIENASGQEQ